MAVSTEDAESLFTEVSEVQRELEKFSVNSIDANEIYELLEAYSFRSDRVEFVTFHLLDNLGIKNNLSSNIIDISDGSFDDIPDDDLYITSPEYDVPDVNDAMALDLSVPSHHYIMDSVINESEKKQVLTNSNSVSDDSSIGPCSSGSLQKTLPSEDNTEASCMTSTTVVKSLESDACCEESSTAAIRVESADECSNPPYENADFCYDVNNNDPNNNTEYEAPVEIENKKDSKVSVNEPDDTEVEFQDQDEIRSKLLGEARLIHRIVPRQNLEQIYSYLEANLDRKNRLQIVMQEFLKMELTSETCTMPKSDCKESGCQGNIVKSKQTEFQAESSGSENSRKIQETCIEPQPSTSSIGEFNTVKTVNEIEVEQCTSSNNDNENIKPLSSSSGEEVELNTSCDTIDEADDKDVPEIETSIENDVNKQVSEEVSSSSFNVEENYREQIYKDINITSTTCINEDSIMDKNVDSNSFVAPDKFLEETAVPSTSTENSDSERKRKSDTNVESSPEKKNKIDEDPTTTSIAVYELTESQQRYKSTLLEIFPDVDPEYLSQQCVKIDSELGLNDVISDMLQNNYPCRQGQETAAIESAAELQPGPSVSVSMEDKIEAQYKTLVAILPNADPTYLHEQCEAMAGNEEEMKNFVSEALENKRYPTREEYLKRQEALALQRKYTEQFSIEGFLEIFPDPVKYFKEEKKSDVSISDYAMPYLKARYKKIRRQDIFSELKRNDYSLTKTCDILDNFVGTMRKTRRPDYECKIPPAVNIPFLQEVAFIENKTRIKDYLKEKKKIKKKAFKQAKNNGELLECGCCYDNEVMAEDIATCNEGHLFCKGCIRKFAEIKIGSGETSFPCLNDCGSEFSLKTLQVVLKPSIFSRMLQRKQLEEVKAAGIEDLETCPFCDFASIPPRDDKVFRCLNPDCMRESCRNCKEPNHIPLRCDEVEKSDEVKVRTYIEDRMTKALVRTCWKCEKKFIKEDGCNKMTCTCGAMMCYICRQPVKDYSHFNGQGGDAYDKCPLYSNNDALHVNPVREEAEKAKKEMKNLNPNLSLKYDPTKILPKAEQINNAQLFHGAHQVGLHIHAPGINVHLPHNNRRQQIGVEVFAGHILNVQGRYGIVHYPHIQNPVPNQIQGNLPLPIPQIPANPVIQRHAPRVRRFRVRNQMVVDPNVHHPAAIQQHLPLPANGELIIQHAQVGNPNVIPPLPPATP